MKWRWEKMTLEKIKNIIKDIEKVEQDGMLSLGDMEKITKKYNISLLQLMTIARYKRIGE